jgi:plastocyanin
MSLIGAACSVLPSVAHSFHGRPLALDRRAGGVGQHGAVSIYLEESMTGRGARGMLTVSVALAGVSCGGGGTGPGGQGTAVMAKANPSGDGQSGAIGTALPAPLRVQITDGGAPVVGRAVNWQIQAPGAGVNPATSSSGADGIATTTVTLPRFKRRYRHLHRGQRPPQSFVATSTGVGTAVTVSVLNDTVLPSAFELRAGGTVTFTWAVTAIGHNVNPVPPAGIPASPGLPGVQNGPFSFDAVFPTTGTYQFFCTAHGSANSGMRGAITVVP